MHLKAYSKSRKITLHKLGELCQAVLNETPGCLSEEQTLQLDAALANAAKQVTALLPEVATEPAEDKEISSSLTQAQQPSLSPSNARTVIGIIGEDTLRRNIAIFLTHHISNLQKLRHAHDEILFRFEQDVYRDTSDTFGRITRNLANAHSGIDKIIHPQTPEEEAYFAECLKLAEEFLSTES